MKCTLVGSVFITGGVQYNRGDEVELSPEMYARHRTKFSAAASDKGAEKVITNDEPPKAKSKKTPASKKSGGKGSAKKGGAK